MASHPSLTEDEFHFLTWTRPSLSRITIEPEELERHCPLDNARLERRGTHQPNTHVRLLNIWNMRALPLEITHLILSLLDLKSLTDFRAVSWDSRALVDGLPEYGTIIQHAPNALRALLSTNMALYFTTTNLFRALSKQDCFICGEFGPFLDLFTCQRCCLNCVINSKALLSIPIYVAKQVFGLNSEMLSTLPTFLSLPGQYTESKKTCPRRISLLRLESIINAQQDNSMASPQAPTLQSVQVPWDSHVENSHRFMPMVRIPTLDQSTGKLDWGVSCQGCRFSRRDRTRGYYDFNTLYSAAGYLEHFQSCSV